MPATASKTRVGVIGGGVAGLTAAHELSDRAFDVTVFEAALADPFRPHAAFGGKARSSFAIPKGGAPLPSEHGFRFFPGFYTHVVETMRLIPDAAGTGTVAQHLIDLDRAVLVTDRRQRLEFPLPTASRTPTWRERLCAMVNFRAAIPAPWECACYVGALARLACSSEARLYEQLEHQSWLQYVNPSSGRRWSKKYQRLFSVGLTRTFVATRAEEMSARTGGRILLQLLYDIFSDGSRQPADRVLDGPTSEVWIEPWHRLLESKHVKFEDGQVAVKLERMDDHRIRGVRFCPFDAILPCDAAYATERSDFDYWVLAIPCEQVKLLLAHSVDVVGKAPELARVFNLRTAWMSGLQFGCDAAAGRLPRAHILCLDSPWALTLIDQAQIWEKPPRDYPVLLSIDISDWESPGYSGVSAELTQKRNDIAEEVWAQLGTHLEELPAPRPCEHSLDPAIKLEGLSTRITAIMEGREPDSRTKPGATGFPDFPIRQGPVIKGSPPRSDPPAAALPSRDPRAQPRTNEEPLMINTPGSWCNRPEPSCPEVSNLFLAGDYVRADTDFASMETANETAKLAVNALLKKCGRSDFCEVQRLQDPEVAWFRIPQTAARCVDEVLFPLGFRAPFRLPIAAWILLFIAHRLFGRPGSG